MSTNRFQVPRLSDDGGRAEARDRLVRNAQLYRAQRLAPLRELEARFLDAKEVILQVHPKEQVDDFGSMEGIETMHLDDLDQLEKDRAPLVERVEARASDVRAEAERIRAANMTELETLRQDFNRLAARVAKLEGAGQAQLPRQDTRMSAPPILGMPGGMGRPAAVGHVGDGGVRRVGVAPATPAPAESGFSRRVQPLNVIAAPDKR